MPKNKKRCGSKNTRTGKPCRYYALTCPWRFTKHRPGADSIPRPSEVDLPSTPEIESYADNASDSYLGLSEQLAGYFSDIPHGLHTNRDDFSKVMGKARGDYPPEIVLHDIIRDMYMMGALWSLSKKYPDGIVTSINNRPRKGGPFIDRGRFIFVGGTALSSAHQITHRYSQDLDFLYVPFPQGNTKDNIRKRRQDIIKASAAGVSTITPTYKRPHGMIVQGSISLPQQENFITLDIVDRKEFCDNPAFVERLDLLEVQMKPLISMVGRAAPEYLDKYPQLGGFSLPVVGEPYIAVTKLDALTRRALTPRFHYQITLRWRDLYDLHCLAQSDKAAHIKELIPEICFFSENDTLRRKNHKRPTGGYGTSDVFKLGTAANDALRAGVEERMSGIVWERPLPTFEEMIDSARSLDG